MELITDYIEWDQSYTITISGNNASLLLYHQLYKNDTFKNRINLCGLYRYTFSNIGKDEGLNKFIKKGKTVLGIDGIWEDGTTDDISQECIATGKTIYSNGNLITGKLQPAYVDVDIDFDSRSRYLTITYTNPNHGPYDGLYVIVERYNDDDNKISAYSFVCTPSNKLPGKQNTITKYIYTAKTAYYHIRIYSTCSPLDRRLLFDQYW